MYCLGKERLQVTALKFKSPGKMIVMKMGVDYISYIHRSKAETLKLKGKGKGRESVN